MNIKRYDKYGAHRYSATTDTGELIAKDLVGITTQLGIMDKGGLVPWAARGSLNAAKERLVEIQKTASSMADYERGIENILGLDGYQIINEKKTTAGDRGTDAHEVCEIIARDYQAEPAYVASDQYVAGVLMTQPSISGADTYLMALAFRNWIIRARPVILTIEKVLVCPECGYGCTTDLELLMGRMERWLVDIKTSGGIYESYALQMAAQTHAIEVTQNGGTCTMAPGSSHRSALLWLSKDAADGAELIEQGNDPDGDFRGLQAILTLYEWRSRFNKAQRERRDRKPSRP